MKLSNLSLAILVALGTAACGGSSSSDSQPTDPNTPVTPDNSNNNNVTPAPTDDNTLVDPTGHWVVDGKDLSTTETVGTLQYIRRNDSEYDRVFNPSNAASASPLLGVKLDDQNPKLTNIVLARQELTRTDGEPVKAQFTGSINKEPLDAAGKPINVFTDNKNKTRNLNPLQVENFVNVDIFADAFTGNTNTSVLHTSDNPKVATAARQAAAGSVATGLGISSPEGFNNAGTGTWVGSGFVNATKPVAALYEADKSGAATATTAAFYDYATDKAATATVTGVRVVLASDVSGTGATNLNRVGKGLVWWSTPATAFENEKTRKGTIVSVDGATASPDENNFATNGLIRIGGNQPTLGQELTYDSETKTWVDHHKTTSRIFGRYHLAFSDNGAVKPVTYNTFTGAKAFVSGLEIPVGGTASDVDLGTGKAVTYSIGAVPATLTNVQYGRVTTNLDLEMSTGTFGDGFQWAQYRKKDDSTAVDNYFYRGTNATTVAQMAALPTNNVVNYAGHALMYGIDNNYHGSGAQNLPNAFAPAGSQGLGLGNFVTADVNFGTNRVVGNVYNLWLLDQSSSALTRDNLVQFQGDIRGNTVIGTADRVYKTGDDQASFKASFFGANAEEMGGSFNSVTTGYGSGYGENDWGGVFGAQQAAGSSNTFQGDDGNPVYSL